VFGHLTLEGFNFPDESAVPVVEVCCVISGLSKGGTSHCVEAQTPFVLSFQTLLSTQARLRPCPEWFDLSFQPMQNVEVMKMVMCHLM